MAKLADFRFAAPLFVVLSGVCAAASGDSSVTWKGGEGDFEDASNWNPPLAPDVSDAGRRVIRGGTAVLSGDVSIYLGGDLLVGQGGPGGLILKDRAELHLKRHLSIGQSGKSDGDVEILDHASLIVEDGMTAVGQRGTGRMTVAPGAGFRLQRGQFRISEGAEGVVTVAGSLDVPRLLFGSDGEDGPAQNGRLEIGPTGRLIVHEGVRFGGHGFHILEVRKHGADITMGSLQASSSALLRFIADSAGVSPLQVQDEASIDGVVLEVDVDLAKERRLVLLTAARIVGECAEVRWLGQKRGKVEYGPKSIRVITDP